MNNAKVVPLEQIQQRVQELRAGGKKVVATNGCFDLLHVGHIRYLKTARKLGDVLVIGINGDQSVRELKGVGRPLNSEADRAEVVAALASVDLVTVFPEVRATRFLESVAPDVYVKGGDYNEDTLNPEERAVLKKIGAKIEIVPFEEGYSTSDLLARMSKFEK
jgi:D-glycero-beta-D-manno-heptose 1-phosphate adenylyltransferase